MGDARAIQIAFVIDEHLRLVDQPAEGVRVDDAVAVALELAAVLAAAARESGGRGTRSSCAAKGASVVVRHVHCPEMRLERRLQRVVRIVGR